jgi:hypothetical protein
MTSSSQLTPRGAAIFGLVFIASSAVPILGGFGVIPIHPTAGTPMWVGVICGVAFFLAGMVLLSDAVAGGTGPDGQLLDTAPRWVRPFQQMVGLSIALILAVVASWIAFGSGERHFSSTIALPFVTVHPATGDKVGRWAFGFGAVLMWIVIATVVAGAARKALARNSAND